MPANRFEVLECRAALDAIRAGDARRRGPPRRAGSTCLAQHVLGMACAAPFRADDLYAEVRRAAPYARISRRKDFDDVARASSRHGGYALGAYRALAAAARAIADGQLHAPPRRASPSNYRMNIGTIVEADDAEGADPARGQVLGEVEEYFILGLVPGDTFVFAGQMLRFEACARMARSSAARAGADAPQVPAYAGRPAAA